MRCWRAALLLILLMGDAAAARRTEVAVVGLHIASSDDAAALENAGRLSEALEATGKIDAVTPGEVRGRIAGRESLIVEGAFLGPGRTNLSEGRVLYERADFESAIPVLESAREQLQDGMVGATDSKDLIDTLLLLGLAHASIGDTDAARVDFERVVVLDPTRELDAVNYPPKMVSLFNDVRAAVRTKPAAQLVVQAAENDADVFLDTQPEGKTPLTLNGLPPGEHYLLVRGTGGKRSYTRIQLTAGQRVVYQAPLQGRIFAEAGQTPAERSRQIKQLYSSLGVHVATGIVVLGGETDNGQVALQLYETRTGNFSQSLSAPAGQDPVASILDLVPAVANWLTDEGTLKADRVSTNTLPMQVNDNPLLSSVLLDPEPIVEKVFVTRGPPWYVWAGIAAVAGGGAATTAVLLTRGGETVDPNQGTIVVAIP